MKDHLEWSSKRKRLWYKSPLATIIYGLIIAIGVTLAIGYASGEY